MFVATLPNRRAKGVDSSGQSDWTKLVGSPGNERRIVRAAEVQPYEVALTRRYTTDAHAVAYVMHDANDEPCTRQPRINKAGLPLVESKGYAVWCYGVLFDIDTPGHVPWEELGPDAIEEVLEQARRVPILRDAVWWFSAKGRGVWLRFAERIAVSRYEVVGAVLRDELLEYGVIADESCSDWTRLIRLAWVEREDGLVQHSVPWIDGHAPRDVSGLIGAIPKARGRARRQVFAVPRGPSVRVLSPEWAPRVHVLAEAVRGVGTEWHSLFLALAGALCQRYVPLDHVEGIVEAVSLATENDDRTEDRVGAARGTVEHFASGNPIAGEDQLLAAWPAVHAAVAQVVPLLAPPAEDDLPDAAGAALRVMEAIRNAPDGVSIVEASCGTGKTVAASRIALERAGRGRTATGRAALGSKTGISVPTNALARQVVANLRANGGTSVARIFSPISELDEHGQPICKYAASARPMADAMMSVPWELCVGRHRDPCPEFKRCPVAGGIDGPEDAQITVGNHGLLGAVIKSAGKIGLRVIDEHPPVLETHDLSPVDVARVFSHGYLFAQKWREVMADVAQEVVRTFTTLPEDGTPVSATTLVSEETLARVRAVDRPKAGPPVKRLHIHRARLDPSFAVEMSRAVRAAWVLYTSLAEGVRCVARRETLHEIPTLRLTAPNAAFVEILRGEGTTVLLDAAADLDVLSAAARTDLSTRTTRVVARDGAPVHRTMMRWTQASRTKLMPGRVPDVAIFASALRAAIAWASEDPACRSLGILTMLPLRMLCEWVADESRPRPKLPAATLEAARATIGPVLRLWGHPILWGHYGALRGLDAWSECDALVTIGDPWPNIGDVHNDVAYIQGDALAGERRIRYLATAELEQAHGRIRAPHRTRPGRALHIGCVKPGGPYWNQAETRELAPGRPPTESAMTIEELSRWIVKHCNRSIVEAARVLGISAKTVRRYLKGEFAIPRHVAEKISGAK